MTLPNPASIHCREFSRELLEDELGRVHAREFGRLLQAASLLRLGLRDDLERWRRAAWRACALAEIDGFEPVGLLRHALTHAPREWAAADVLSAAARAISSHRSGVEDPPPC